MRQERLERRLSKLPPNSGHARTLRRQLMKQEAKGNITTTPTVAAVVAPPPPPKAPKKKHTTKKK